MSLLQNSNAISAGGYQISNSLRFQSASSTYLARTPASNGNRQKFTFSFWAKRGTLSAAQEMYFVNSGGGNFSQISWTAGNGITITSVDASVASCELITTPVYRDPSAWYHIVISVDTTQATAANRVIIYVNGSQVTALSTATYPSLNYNFQLNNTTSQNIGRPSTSTFDGYLAEFNFIDGQALTPSSFGETNTLTGQWVAKKYTGTYGTNGFYLPFSNGTSTTTLGADSSGNGNNWTLTNFTRSAGVSDCWMKDVPSGNGGASGTQPNSNYAVISPIDISSVGATIALANLRFNNGSAGSQSTARATIGVSSGKWYWETTCTTFGGSNPDTGILGTNSSLASADQYVGNYALGYSYGGNGQKRNNNAGSAYGATYTSGDVIGIALDMDAGTLTFYKNNSSQGTAFTGLSGTFSPAVSGYNGVLWNANFGQRSFAYTPPSGFKALCTANLPASTIVKGNKYMDALAYTGDGTNKTITGLNFYPDFLWIKNRATVQWNNLWNSVVGSTKCLFSNATNSESTNDSYGYVSSFTSTGFGVTAGATAITNVNGSGNGMIAWAWNAGSGSSSSNTNGSITSTVSVNATAGFSIVTYTGNGTNGATVGHGLGVNPKLYIIKSRNSASGVWWVSGYPAFGAPFSANNNYLELDATNAIGTASTAGTTSSASTITFNNSGISVNSNGTTYVAYCFAEIAGFSKFGSYTGNGSTDGTFVYCGFRPKYVMIKRTDGANDWFIQDTSRSPYNVVGVRLEANLSDAEASDNSMDILSNGFKLRGTTNGYNGSTFSYIYMAFAESPFANSNSR